MTTACSCGFEASGPSAEARLLQVLGLAGMKSQWDRADTQLVPPLPSTAGGDRHHHAPHPKDSAVPQRGMHARSDRLGFPFWGLEALLRALKNALILEPQFPYL